MTLGFVFDTKFKKYRNDYYSTNLSEDILTQRYLTVFDEMVVVGRCEETLENPIGKYAKSSGVNIKFDCIPNEKPLKRFFNFLKHSRQIEKVLSDCDAVICRGWRGTRICKKLGKPYLVEVVNCAWDSYWNHSVLGKIVAPIIFMIRRATTKTAPYVLYVTSDFLQHRYPTTGKSVAVSDVDLKEFDDTVLSIRIDKINNKSTDEKIIIGTAAAVDVSFKGQRFVIRALAKLKSSGLNNFEYQIGGKGDNKKLKRLAQKLNVDDCVVFKGSVVHEDIFAWYDSIDIYIQPSLQEGLPRALIEAMSRGLTCYGTKTGGIPELLDVNYVCSANRFIARKLAKFIATYNRSIAIETATRNFSESKKYAADLLEKRRHDFLLDFAKRAKGDKNA